MSDTPDAPVEAHPVVLTPLNPEPTGLSDASALDDVPLDLSVDLGYADLPLAAARELSAGHVVPLVQATGDPVTIRINGTPIAEGELMVVGDRYAVRITRVLTPGEVEI
jgi:flagellar motor switch protein FliN/FliY